MAATEVTPRREPSAGSRQLHQRLQELKLLVGRPKNLYHDHEAWSMHNELLSVCQQLLLTDLDYALDKKVEADLWNACFKDFVSYLQQAAREGRGSASAGASASAAAAAKKRAGEAQVTLTWFLEMASGSYIMFLEEIRSRFNLDLPFLRSPEIYGVQQQRPLSPPPANKNSITYLCQHCLIHLGDIARYRIQLRQAEKFYRQALQLAPGSGHAYNQMALLEANRGNKLSSAYFYSRALALKFPFPAAASNLSKLLSKIDQDQKSLPAKDVRINSQTFLPYTLRLHALLHHAVHLKTAAKICHLLNTSLTSLVAAEAIDTWTLIQVVAISLFLMQDVGVSKSGTASQDEQTIVSLLCEFVAGLLNAFLLPVYTLKQGTMLLDYFALPAIKLILDWVVLNPRLLEERAFRKRLQIWPSLCRMLNELAGLAGTGLDKSDDLDKLADYPLPEDFDLQAFQPLHERLKRYNFRQVLELSGQQVESDSVLRLRARRMVELGLELSSFDSATRMIKASSGDDGATVSFEAIDRQIPADLVQELDALDLSSSSDSESDEDTDEGSGSGLATPEFTKDEAVVPAKKAGILKLKSPDVAGSAPGAAAPVGKQAPKPRRSTNVAMQSILQKQQQQPKPDRFTATFSSSHVSEMSAPSRQVTFHTPSPANSQDSAPDRACLAPTVLQQGLPDFSLPPPPIPKQTRPGLGLIGPNSRGSTSFIKQQQQQQQQHQHQGQQQHQQQVQQQHQQQVQQQHQQQVQQQPWGNSARSAPSIPAGPGPRHLQSQPQTRPLQPQFSGSQPQQQASMRPAPPEAREPPQPNFLGNLGPMGLNRTLSPQAPPAAPGTGPSTSSGLGSGSPQPPNPHLVHLLGTPATTSNTSLPAMVGPSPQLMHLLGGPRLESSRAHVEAGLPPRNPQMVNLLGPQGPGVPGAGNREGAQYSLFSGPSWAGGGSLLGAATGSQDARPQPQQPFNQGGGASALESLLLKQQQPK